MHDDEVTQSFIVEDEMQIKLGQIFADAVHQVIAKVEGGQKNVVTERMTKLLQNLRIERREYAKLALPILNGLTFVNVFDILYCKAAGNYTEIFLKEGQKHLVSRQLHEYEKLLNPFNFFRIHHSTLIQLEYIKSYIRDDGGYVVMSDNASLAVSRRKRDTFLKRIGYKP